MFHRQLLKAPRIWSYILALLPRFNLSERPATALAEASLDSQAHHLEDTSRGYHHTALPASGHGVYAQAGVPFNTTKEISPHRTAVQTPRGLDNVSLLATSQQLDFHPAAPVLQLEDAPHGYEADDEADHHGVAHEDFAGPQHADEDDLADHQHAGEATSWHYGEGFDKLYELAHQRLPKASNDAYYGYHGGDPDSPKDSIKLPDHTFLQWSFPNRVKSWKEHSESSLKHINDMLEKAKKTKQQLYESHQKFIGDDAHQSGKINDVIQKLGGEAPTPSSSGGNLGWLNR